MNGLKTSGAIALVLAAMTAQALAQAAMSEPAAFQSMYPNRDVLNGGAPNGSLAYPAPVEAYARMPGPAEASCAQRYRSYDPGSGTFLGNDGRRHSCR